MGLHRIRLAAPWEYNSLSSGQPENCSATIICRLPCSVNDPDVEVSTQKFDVIQLSRKFHCPSGINSTTRVLIEIQLADTAAMPPLTSVLLNKLSLPIPAVDATTDMSLLFDVSGRLLPFNLLQLQFPLRASHTSTRLLSVNLMIEE